MDKPRSVPGSSWSHWRRETFGPDTEEGTSQAATTVENGHTRRPSRDDDDLGDEDFDLDLQWPADELRDEPERQPPSSAPLDLASRGGLVAQVNDLAGQVDALSTTMDDFRELLADRLYSVQDIVSRTSKSHVATLDDYRQGFEDSVSALRRRFDGSLSELRRDLDEGRTELRRDLDDRLTELRSSLSDSDRSLRQLTANVDEVLAHSTAGRDTSPATDTLLAELRDAARDHDGTIASLTDRIDDHSAAMTALRSSFSDSDRSLRQLTAKVDQVLAHSTADRDSSPETDSLLAELRDAARDHDGTIASLTSRIDDHSAAMTAQLTAFEAVREEQVREVRSLAEQVAKLKRRVTLRVGANTATLEDGEVDRIVDAVVSKLSQAFEVVPEDAAKPTSSSKPASSPKPPSSAERKPAPAPERKRAPSSERKPEPSAPPSRKRTAKASH